MCYTEIKQADDDCCAAGVTVVTHETEFGARVKRAIEWIYQSYNRAKPHVKQGYDREVRHPEQTRQLLDCLGAPDRAAYNIAVTGSKGKGTHAILLAALLQQAGWRVGLFTSPHLVDYLERIRVDGQIISEQAFLDAIAAVQSCVDLEDLPLDRYHGPVGLVAATAATWFRTARTDLNVYELGRGARHDDVNQIVHQGAIITPVFLEHAAQLGPTLKDVCWEKAGIVTVDTGWVVSSRQGPLMTEAITVACCNRPAEYLGATFDAHVVADGDHRVVIVNTNRGETRVAITATASIFADNIAVAVRAAERAWQDLAPFTAFPNRFDLRQLRLPGRMEVLRRDPLTILDGTIHRANAIRVRAVLDQWRQDHVNGCVGAVFGLPADKDGEGVIDALADALDVAVFTQSRNPHLRFTAHFADYARSLGLHVIEATDIATAIELGTSHVGSSGILLLLGTQSFIGDVLQDAGIDSTSLWL